MMAETNCPYCNFDEYDVIAKKPVPVRSAQVLLIQSGAEWVWQQRPNSGLWGGLWCLPIIENAYEFEQQCQQLSLKNIVKKTHISHSFTHFTWHLEAVIFVVDQDQQGGNVKSEIKT
jgi:A/G-specific adenine glycosylase